MLSALSKRQSLFACMDGCFLTLFFHTYYTRLNSKPLHVSSYLLTPRSPSFGLLTSRRISTIFIKLLLFFLSSWNELAFPWGPQIFSPFFYSLQLLQQQINGAPFCWRGLQSERSAADICATEWIGFSSVHQPHDRGEMRHGRLLRLAARCVFPSVIHRHHHHHHHLIIVIILLFLLLTVSLLLWSV